MHLLLVASLLLLVRHLLLEAMHLLLVASLLLLVRHLLLEAMHLLLVASTCAYPAFRRIPFIISIHQVCWVASFTPFTCIFSKARTTLPASSSNDWKFLCIICQVFFPEPARTIHFGKKKGKGGGGGGGGGSGGGGVEAVDIDTEALIKDYEEWRSNINLMALCSLNNAKQRLAKLLGFTLDQYNAEEQSFERPLGRPCPPRRR